MDASEAWATKGTLDYMWRFDTYKETVSRLFPALPKDYVDTGSISKVDALTLGHFLECYPREVVALDIGTSVGVSTFHLANQPKVLKVIGVEPHLTVADEIRAKSIVLGSISDTEPLRTLKVLDVVRAALAECGEAQQKIHLRTGVVGRSQGSSPDDLKKVEVPVLESSEGVSLVAFIHGLHTKEGVQADLEAVFEKNSHAVAILGNCRGSWGPFVQAGVVSFMEKAEEKYHFQLFGDLGSSVATSYLGIVYPDIDAAEVRQTLVEFTELFSERLNLLRLLRREEELIEVVNSYGNEVDRLRTVADSLRIKRESLSRRNAELEERIARYSSRRYKLVDALSNKVLRVPGLSHLVRGYLMRSN